MELLSYEILNASGEADKNSIPMFSYDTYPCFLDLAFPKNMSVHDVIVVFPENTDVDFTVFSSLDGVNFYKKGKSPKIARFIRIFIKYYSGARPTINNIEVLGEDCSFPAKKIVFREPENFEKTPFAQPISDDEIIDDVKGIIGRTIGEKYIEQFDLRLDRRLKDDYFSVASLRGKIVLTSNSGVGLASAFNCYLKEVCNCHVSRFGNQVDLPHNLPQVNGKIDRKTDCKYRYAYNYCTHSYSMAFWTKEQWQKEIDFLAMNGVNLVLDILGMEEVYRRFLTKLGYRHREIKNFLVGPAYYAWFYMSNICSLGGPIHDDFFYEKCEMARENHRRMKALGMDVVLQAYTGIVPRDIQKKDREVPVIEQGKWKGIERPLIVSPDSVHYVKYAKLFYECQKEVFGDITHFYAGDVCHEGGKLDKKKAKESFSNVMESMLSFDKNAMWVVQCWAMNPTPLFTKSVKQYRDKHILMLDLNAEKINHNANNMARMAKYGNVLFGLLNNFGGRHGLFGDLPSLLKDVKSTSTRPNFKGLALTAESVNVNPIVTDLFFSFIWENVENISEWVQKYAIRRYGKENENIAKAMEVLLKTAYGNDTGALSFGATETMFCRRPLDPETKMFTARGVVKLPYSKDDFDEAVKLFLADYDKFKNNECYIYDAVDLLRQSLANKLSRLAKKCASEYKSKDYFAFMDYSKKMLDLADMLDRVLLNCKDFSFSSYIEPVCEYTEKLDDFTKELYMINAKALITTWYCRLLADKGNLHDYAHRQMGDLINSFYKMRWEKLIEQVQIEMDGGKPQEIDWFKVEWDWVLSETKYSKKVREDSLKALGKQILEK
ncbi:MAG: alpha-N-acetylglucosaminidase C-terminal domain-containing protein [Clostridia bacterium]|nr:alpha-N-acetylglucosaminidase C-terminal domain-containing protein [Clostridia bacterium]